MPLRARKRKSTVADPSGASDENSFTAAAKSLLTRVKTLLASSGRPVASLPIDAGVISELTELFVRMAEQWATITDDQKDAFDAICVAIQRDPCEMRRLVWKQRFHRTPAAELCDPDARQDQRCRLCGAEVNTPSVCPKAPTAAGVWKPRRGEVIWIHGKNRPLYMAIATIAGELTPPAPAPVYRKQKSGIVDFIAYALRARDRIAECLRRWPQYEPLPDHPKTCANEYLQDADGRFYPACYHRNRSKLHSELIPRYIRDTSQTPLARAIFEATQTGTLTVLDSKLHRLDSAIHEYTGCLLESNSQAGSKLLELNEAINALAPYANTGGSKRRTDSDGRSNGRKPRKTRMKREVAEPLIAKRLSQRPHDTAAEVAAAVGCSVGVVVESTAWKLNRKRLKIARRQGIDPKAVKLNEAAINAAGGDKMRQLHDHRQQATEIDDEIDAQERELCQGIVEYKRKHPDATTEQVASAVGCTSRDVERRQATLDGLVAEQSADLLEDVDVEDSTTQTRTRRKWTPKRV